MDESTLINGSVTKSIKVDKIFLQGVSTKIVLNALPREIVHNNWTPIAKYSAQPSLINTQCKEKTNTLLTDENMIVKTNDFYSVVIQSIIPASIDYHWKLNDVIDNNVEFIPYTTAMVSPGLTIFMFKSVNF